MLQLGAAELGSEMSPSLAFGREFAHLFMARLTAVAALAERWSSVVLSIEDAELDALASGTPPLTGAEYLGRSALHAWWLQLHTAAREEITAAAGDVNAWLLGKHPSWNLVGRVCFHLAENKGDEQYPFAFLATYAPSLSAGAREVSKQRLHHVAAHP